MRSIEYSSRMGRVLYNSFRSYNNCQMSGQFIKCTQTEKYLSHSTN